MLAPQELSQITLPLSRGEILRHGWDGFGSILWHIAQQMPLWVWLAFCVLLLLSADRLAPVLFRWCWRYLTRSSLLD